MGWCKQDITQPHKTWLEWLNNQLKLTNLSKKENEYPALIIIRISSVSLHFQSVDCYCCCCFWSNCVRLDRGKSRGKVGHERRNSTFSRRSCALTFVPQIQYPLWVCVWCFLFSLQLHTHSRKLMCRRKISQKTTNHAKNRSISTHKLINCKNRL